MIVVDVVAVAVRDRTILPETVAEVDDVFVAVEDKLLVNVAGDVRDIPGLKL